MRELIANAITDFDNFFSLLENKEKSKIGESFRSRSRELPVLIEDIGLIPALSFCYAKASNEVYNNVRELIEKREVIKEDDATKQGYGIYFYFILNRLKALKLIKVNLDDPINALKEIMNGKERIATVIIRPYITQLKKLSEAVFKTEGER
jgi:CRISPR type III-B/RAMP module-associated protein Cmr5